MAVNNQPQTGEFTLSSARTYVVRLRLLPVEHVVEYNFVPSL
jgi:hypothetical protein